MLNSLLIRNFRLFKELKIERLSRVNLFVGKNNAGKSCLLEALRIYASNASLGVLSDLVLEREGYWETKNGRHGDGLPKVFENPLKENPFRHLFHERRFPNIGKRQIEIGSLSSEADRLDLHIGAYHFSPNGEKAELCASETPLDHLGAFEIWLEAKETGGNRQLFPIAADLRDPEQRTRFQTSVEPRCAAQLVPAQRLDDNQVAKLWDEINLTDLENDVIACLKLIQPSIRGIALVGDGNRRIPIIRNEGSTERLPIRSLGDGMTRLFHISLALVNARDGFLLIDEFENGLHWRIQPKLWEIIFRLAEEFNIQVFATTHSRDCVLAFQEAWTEKEDLGTFHRLNPDSMSRPKCTNYTLEDLSDSLETDVEVR